MPARSGPTLLHAVPGRPTRARRALALGLLLTLVASAVEVLVDEGRSPADGAATAVLASPAIDAPPPAEEHGDCPCLCACACSGAQVAVVGTLALTAVFSAPADSPAEGSPGRPAEHLGRPLPRPPLA